MTNIILEATPLDKTGAPRTIRMSSIGIGSSAGSQIDRTEWLPVITTPPSQSYSLANGSGTLGALSISLGSIQFLIDAQFGNGDWNQLVWQGAPFTAWWGNEGAPLGQYTKFATGTLSGLVNDEGVSELGLRTVEAQLDVPTLSARYAGTGGQEGSPGRKGAFKPRSHGVTRSVTPVAVDDALLIYQVHGYGPVEAITTLYEFGQPYEAAKTNVVDFAALAALTLKPGEWATCLALGMFRLGGRADKKLVADVVGGMAGNSAPRTAGAIISQLLSEAGVSASRIGDMSALSLEWSFYATEDQTIRETIDKAAQDAGGYVFPDPEGVWQCGRYKTTRSPIALHKDRSSEPLVQSISEINNNDPIAYVEVGYDRNWTVHSDGDISPRIKELEGKIVAGDEFSKQIERDLKEVKADADFAVRELEAMLADGVLDRADKRRVIDRLEEERVRYTTLKGSYASYNVQALWDAYDTQFKAWEAFLLALQPSIYDNELVTPVDKAAYLARLVALSGTLEALLTGISNSARKTADYSQVRDDAGTKPQDNATVGAPTGTPVAGIPAEQLVNNVSKNSQDIVKVISDAVAEGQRLDAAIKRESDKAVVALDAENQATALLVQNTTKTLTNTIDSEIAAAKQFATAGDETIMESVESVRTATGDNTAEIKRVDTALTTKEVAITKRIDEATTEYRDLNGKTNTRINETIASISGPDGSLTQRATTLEAQFRGDTGSNLLTKINTVETAVTDGRFASASRATALEASVSNVGSSIARNDKFTYWPDGQAMPANWVTWQAGGNYHVERHGGRGGSAYCIRTLNDNANVDSGFYQSVLMTGPGKYVIEVCAESDASGFSGAGVTLSGLGGLAIDFCSDADTNGSVGDQVNSRRSWSKMVDIGSYDSLSLHAMHGWSAFGRPVVAKYMFWHYLSLRPATDGEIKAGKADNELNRPGGALARITGLETVTTNGTFATATRAEEIAAEVFTGANRNALLTSRVKNVEDATTDGRFAAASRVNTLEATVAATSNSVVRNDTFNSWPDGQSHPSNWVAWQTYGNYRTNRLAPGRGGGQYCVQTLNDVADVDSGFYQTINTAGAGKWVVEVTVNGDGSGLRGAGVTLHGAWNLDFLSDPDTNGYRGDSTGEVRSWTKMFDIDGRDQINVHAMHGWSGFGRGMAAKYMVWHRLSLRPATAGEILAGKADDTLNKPGGLVAKVDSHESTLVNLPANYATASRASNLEAQMNGNSASNLLSKITNLETVTSNGTFASATRANTLEAQLRREVPSVLNNAVNEVNGRIDTVAGVTDRTLRAVIEDRAAAYANDRAGAVASTVTQLRSEYNQARAELTTTSGTAADAYGRSRAFLQQTAVAGDGRAQLRLYADSNGGGGVDIVGDVRISGNLVVDGSISGFNKLANDSVTRTFVFSNGASINGGSSGGGGGGGGDTGGGGGGGGYYPEMPNQA